MGDGYFDFLYNMNKKQPDNRADQQKPEEMGSKIESVAQDEAIGKPWTHKYTIYCSTPAEDFLENLKKNECIVAVYEKLKDTEDKVSDKESAPSNA